jgi:transcriptional regulator with XRE-family HTH domain
MGKDNARILQLSDKAILEKIGGFIRQKRLQQNVTQSQLARNTNLNRSTIVKIENGESITLTSLIPILRVLNSLYVLEAFEVSEEISPLEYSKLKRKRKLRAGRTSKNKTDKSELGW